MINNIIKSNLRDTSKRHYIDKLNYLKKITKHDTEWIMDNCNETLDFLYNNNSEVEAQTVRTYINTVLALYKYNPIKKEELNLEYKKWVEKFKEMDEITESKYMNSQPSKKQIEVFIEWDKIIEIRDKLNKNTIKYFLLSLYTMIPPARADYGRVKIYINKKPTDNEIKEEPNYLLINNDRMILILNEFKSKGKKIEKYEEELPKNLIELIKRSLKRNPREYLVVSPITNQPYNITHSYNVYVNRKFNEIFKKDVTINTLRHSYGNNIDWTNSTPLELERQANKMMHSINTMNKYKLKFS